MKKRRVGVLLANMSPRSGGVYEAVLGQVRALNKAGRSTEIFSAPPPEYEKEQSAEGMIVHTVRSRGPLAFVRSPALEHALEVGAAQILHLHGIWLPSLSISARRWRQRNEERVLVISPHGMLDPWALRNARWKKRLAMAAWEDATMRTANSFHALNMAEAEAIRALDLGVPVAVIPNGVDLPPINGAAAQLPFNDDGRRILLFLGRLHPKKGLAETLRAWALLIAARPDLCDDWRLVIAGWDDGDHLSELQVLTDELKLHPHVIFTGAVYGVKKTALLSHADAFVLASHSEGLPMAILEAWAHACPVFMTQACNLPEGFEAGAAIRIAPEPQALADTLSAHLDQPELSMVGQAGRRLVELQFSWDAVGHQLDSLYAWLTGEQTGKPESLIK